MQTFFTIAIVGIVAWFAITNAGAVVVHLFLWQVSASLAIVVGVAFLLGFLLGILRLAPSAWRDRSKARAAEKALETMRTERDALAERTEVLESQVKQLAPETTETPPQL